MVHDLLLVGAKATALDHQIASVGQYRKIARAAGIFGMTIGLGGFPDATFKRMITLDLADHCASWRRR